MGPDHERLLDRIYRAAVDPDDWPDVLTGIADHIGAQGGMLARVGATRAGSAFIHARLSESCFELFETRYLWNPWTLATIRVPRDRAVIMGSIVDRAELGRTAFYADVLAPQRTTDQINVALTCLGPGGGVGGAGFPFEARHGDRMDEGVRRLDRLIPHLRRALEASLTLRHMDRERDLGFAVSLLPHAALLLDREGRIVFANEMAEALLHARDGLGTTEDGGLRLNAALPAEAAAFRLALARAIAISNGEDAILDEGIRLSRPSGKPPLLVRPVPLPMAAFPLWTRSGSARVIVLVIDPVAELATDLAMLRSVFALTPAEARVAMLVGGGEGTPKAAAQLGIATTTVKTHLQRAFDKTGVRSQVQLARLLAALPPKPPSR